VRDCRSCDCMVVRFTTTYAISSITTKIVSSNPAHGEVYSIQYYVIKFVSDLYQVSGFLWVLQFPPATDRHDITEILLKEALDTITLTLVLVTLTSQNFFNVSSI
jgi:hypothetical protein